MSCMQKQRARPLAASTASASRWRWTWRRACPVSKSSGWRIWRSRKRGSACARPCAIPGTASRNRITVNLAPANLRKDGSGLDLPIAIGILVASGYLPQGKVDGKLFIGELSLEGGIRGVSGVLPMVLEARRCGVEELYLPPQNAAEGALVEGLRIYAPATLGN